MIVPAQGPRPAKIAFVGEAPGDTEIKEGRPFVGTAGRILDSLLTEVGIKREECFVTNLVETQPPGNDFGRFYADSKREQPTEYLLQQLERLERELAECRPNIICCLGAEPLRWLTGRRGIEAWRGSVVTGSPAGCIELPASAERADGKKPRRRKPKAPTNAGSAEHSRAAGEGIDVPDPSQRRTTPDFSSYKCIGTWHPAAIARQWTYRVSSVVDLRRVALEAQTPELKENPRHHTTVKDLDAGIALLNHINLEATHVSFDIETATQEGFIDISAIALCSNLDPNWAICVPFFFHWGQRHWDSDQELALWDVLREILTNPEIEKSAHNGSYDIDIIERCVGCRVTPFAFDTMLGFHALQLELPKGLSFLTSWYTDQPYYKDGLTTKDEQEFFKYNATDALVTYEIAQKLIAELKTDGLWEFYLKHLHALWEPLHEMQLRGVNFNWQRRNTVKKHYQESIAVLQRNLDAKVGHPLNVNASAQMKEWLYGAIDKGGLGLEARFKRVKGGDPFITADEAALQELYHQTKNDALRLVLAVREKQKILSNYLDVDLDEDKRMRCSWCVAGAGKGEKDEGGTETGRLSSRRTVRGTGSNMQNVPDGIIRELYLPDEGCILINADLSQAEARVVAYLANESRLIRVFEEGGDIHRRNAANIFKVAEEEVPDNLRQLAKRVVHASNYGMGPITFAKTAGIPVADARKLLNQYHATYPGIQNWHSAVKAKLGRGRYLDTPFGRRRYFWAHWGEGLFKEAYAYVPQSTVADQVNQALIGLSNQGYEILLQAHDSILLQVRTEMVDQAVREVLGWLQRPILIGGKPVVIPAQAKVGENWGRLEAYDAPVVEAVSNSPSS